MVVPADGFEELLTSRFTALLVAVKTHIEIELHTLHEACRKYNDGNSGRRTSTEAPPVSHSRNGSRSPSPVPHAAPTALRGKRLMMKEPPKVSVESQFDKGLLHCGEQFTASTSHVIEEELIHQIRDHHFHPLAPSLVFTNEHAPLLGTFSSMLHPASASRRVSLLEIPAGTPHSHSRSPSQSQSRPQSRPTSASNSARSPRNSGHQTQVIPIAPVHPRMAVQRARQRERSQSPNRDAWEPKIASDNSLEKQRAVKHEASFSLLSSSDTSRSTSMMPPQTGPQMKSPSPPCDSPPTVFTIPSDLSPRRASVQTDASEPSVKAVKILPDVENKPRRKSCLGGESSRTSHTFHSESNGSELSCLDDHADVEDDPEDFLYRLSPEWESLERPTVRLSCDVDLGEAYGMTSLELADPNNPQAQPSFLDKLVLRPTSTLRISWDILGFFLITYDIIVLPLQFFDLEQKGFLEIMTWTVRLYWTSDFPLSFMTGYEKPGAFHLAAESALSMMELRFRHIARKYMRTWMAFDMVIITFDWLELAFDGLESMAAARVGKLAKILRLLKMIRLMRVFRTNRNATLPEFMKQITYNSLKSSEKTQIVFSIARIVLAMTVVTHFMACIWYAIGNSWSEGYDNNWTKEFNVERHEVSFEYSYATSFHWSLTQFAGNAEVVPVNTLERVFAVFALLFGFIFAAFIVSSITSAMTRLQIVMARQSTQVSMLNRYLSDNKISTKLALRVQKNAQYASMQNERNTPEANIELLGLVSDPLRVELHYEIFGPVLMWHPFFNFYAEMNPAALRRICHTAVSRLTLFPGDVLFSTGEMPHFPRMYFCCSGRLEYIHDAKEKQAIMREKSWACEASLWTSWPHHGSLRASVKSHTEIVLTTLNAQVFENIAVNFATVENWPKRYGSWFVDHLNSQPQGQLSDLKDADVDFDYIVDEIIAGRLGQIAVARKSLQMARSMSQIAKDPTSSTEGQLMVSKRNSLNSQKTESRRSNPKRATFKDSVDNFLAGVQRSFSGLSMAVVRTSRSSGRGASTRSNPSETRISSNHVENAIDRMHSKQSGVIASVVPLPGIANAQTESERTIR